MQRLAQRSHEKSIYTHTDFLDGTELVCAMQADKTAVANGGTELAERKIVRFGTDLGEDTQAFPLQILKITPLGGKYATPISHRDVLGAITGLGVERSKIGDIFIGEDCYAVVYDTVAPLLMQELSKVGANHVSVELITEVPDSCRPKTEPKSFTADSNRLDVILARTFNISREKACERIQRELVKINGQVVTKPSRPLKPNDTISARGLGKLVYVGEQGQSRKGKTYFSILLFR